MTAKWIKNEAFGRLQAAYENGVDQVKAAWLAGSPDPTLPLPSATDVTAGPLPITPAVTRAPMANGATITAGGLPWTVQSGTPDGVSIGDDGSIFFHAKAGERASFDPPRKIRAELGGSKTFAKGEVIHLKGTFNINPSTVMADADWLSLIQIHSADVRFADGVPVSASPMFCLDFVPGTKTLRVRAETGKGLPAPNTFFPLRVLGTFPVTFGIDHVFELTVVDGHGGDGRVVGSIDGKVVCDFNGPTGYEYPDLVPPLNGKPQATGSYLKAGIYAGKSSGSNPPATVAAFTLKLAA